ncbi:MAG: ABC transporter ATP-binding protein [Porticoccaceae bacterium]|jgi:iron complex transport system ATP-binding protein
MTPKETGGRVLSASEVDFARRGRLVLKGVSLHLEQGEIVSLLGPNGAGKSTLLRLMLGLLKPGKGSIELDGHPLRHYPRRHIARRLAYVPQSHVPPFPYTVEQIVGLGRLPVSGLLRLPRADDGEIVHAMLDKLGIRDLAARPYTEVSGGERQLVLIARALAQGSKIIVMDEPAAGLDYGNQHRLLAHLRQLAADGYAVLFTTHHPEHALLASHRTALIQGGEIIAQGATDAVLTARNIERLYGLRVRPVAADDRRFFLPY